MEDLNVMPAREEDDYHVGHESAVPLLLCTGNNLTKIITSFLDGCNELTGRPIRSGRVVCKCMPEEHF